MESYVFSIEKAFIAFLFVAMILTIPFLIVNYRKYGYVNKFRVFITFSFLYYCISALYLVILPFPSTRDTCSLQAPGTVLYNFVPFTFIHDIMKETSVRLTVPSTYLHLLTERAFLQVIFNFILLLPLGVYIRYFFKNKKIWTSAIIGFSVSLFFEITQGTGLYGLYNCPYRLFDVDDLILNTSGSIVGFLVAPIFLYLFPSKEKLDVGVDLEGKPVSLVHRLLAFLTDMIVVNSLVSWINLTIGQKLAGFVYFPATFFSIYFLYFVVFVFLTNGRTIGMFIVRLKIHGQNSKLQFKEILTRNVSLYFGYGLLTYLPIYIVMRMEADHNIKFLGILFVIVIQILFYAHFIWRLIRQKRTFYYELLSETRIERKRRG